MIRNWANGAYFDANGGVVLLKPTPHGPSALVKITRHEPGYQCSPLNTCTTGAILRRIDAPAFQKNFHSRDFNSVNSNIP